MDLYGFLGFQSIPTDFDVWHFSVSCMDHFCSSCLFWVGVEPRSVWATRSNWRFTTQRTMYNYVWPTKKLKEKTNGSWNTFLGVRESMRLSVSKALPQKYRERCQSVFSIRRFDMTSLGPKLLYTIPHPNHAIRTSSVHPICATQIFGPKI